MLLVSTRIPRGGHLQQQQWELQIHSSSPRINLKLCSYFISHFKCLSTVTLIIIALLTIFLTPLPPKSQAQLTLTEVLTNACRWVYCFYDAEDKKHSQQTGRKETVLISSSPKSTCASSPTVTKAQCIKAQVDRPCPY